MFLIWRYLMNKKLLVFIAAISLGLIGCNSEKEEKITVPQDKQQQAATPITTPTEGAPATEVVPTAEATSTAEATPTTEAVPNTDNQATPATNGVEGQQAVSTQASTKVLLASNSVDPQTQLQQPVQAVSAPDPVTESNVDTKQGPAFSVGAPQVETKTVPQTASATTSPAVETSATTVVPSVESSNVDAPVTPEESTNTNPVVPPMTQQNTDQLSTVPAVPEAPTVSDVPSLDVGSDDSQTDVTAESDAVVDAE